MSMRDRRLDITSIVPGDVIVLESSSYRVNDVTRDEKVILENVSTHELRVLDLDDITTR